MEGHPTTVMSTSCSGEGSESRFEDSLRLGVKSSHDRTRAQKRGRARGWMDGPRPPGVGERRLSESSDPNSNSEIPKPRPRKPDPETEPRNSLRSSSETVVGAFSETRTSKLPDRSSNC